MKKRILIVMAFVTFGASVFGQTKPTKATEMEKQEVIYTSLKPADATPATFSSQEELKMSVQSKKNNIIEQIKLNKDKPSEIQKLREQLWRFENAIVVPVK